MTRQQALSLRDGCDLILALAALTDRQRHAVTARIFRDLKWAEVAAEMGLTIPGARIHYDHAIHHLHNRFQHRRHDLLEAA